MPGGLDVRDPHELCLSSAHVALFLNVCMELEGAALWSQGCYDAELLCTLRV